MSKSNVRLDDLSWLEEFEVEEEAEEVSYVDVDDSGQAVDEQAMAMKALEPENKLQVALLGVSKNKRFASTGDRTRWRRLQGKANATDNGRVFLAWLRTCIQWGEKKNATVRRLSYRDVISLAENEAAFNEFSIKSRDKILKKPSIEELGEMKERAEQLSEQYDD